MCFGNEQTSKTVNSNESYTPAPWLQSAAQGNLDFARQLQQNGFTPYSGQQVASFSPQQSQSFNMGGGLAGAEGSNVNNAANALNQYFDAAGGGPRTVTPETISSQMSPYMNSYVSLALAPQLKAAQDQQSLNMQQMQGQATSAGAFGDPRAKLLQSNQQLVNDLSNQGLIGNAYNAAFNTAIGAGAQDVANNLNAQTTNAGGLYQNWLSSLIGGANTGFGLGTQGTNLLNQLGAQQTAQGQAGLNAAYNQWLMSQQYPFQTTQLLDQAITSGSVGAPSTKSGQQVTQQPDNSGFGILGSLLGTGMQMLPFMFAEGGDPPVGQPSIIGERGPEIFVPKESGTVVPYEKVKEAIDKKKSLSTKEFEGKSGTPGYAFGGSPQPLAPNLVGEHGPELFVPNAGGWARGGFGGGSGSPPSFASLFGSQNGNVSPFLSFLMSRLAQAHPGQSPQSNLPQPSMPGPQPSMPGAAPTPQTAQPSMPGPTPSMPSMPGPQQIAMPSMPGPAPTPAPTPSPVNQYAAPAPTPAPAFASAPVPTPPSPANPFMAGMGGFSSNMFGRAA